MKGAAEQIRTVDTGIFSPLLYHLSYSGMSCGTYFYPGFSAIVNRVDVGIPLGVESSVDIRQKALSAYQRAMGAGAAHTGGDKESSSAVSGKSGGAGGVDRPRAADGGGVDRDRSGALDGLLKTGEPRESRLGRVARFLVLLGTEEAAGVLKHLPEAEVQKIVAEISNTEALSEEEARRILAEFGYRSGKKPENRSGGRDRAEEMLTLAFGTEKADQILRRSVPISPEERFSFLHDLEPHQIEHLLRKESVQVRALVIAHLPSQLAAQVVGRLDDDEKKSVSLRVARMGELSPELIEQVATLLKERIRKDGVPVTEELDGTERLAEILRHMEPLKEQLLLESLREGAEDLAEEVEQRLYSIDIILEIRDDDLQRVLRRVDDQEIGLLLKGKSEEFRGKMLRNLSERRQRIVVDEYHHLGPVRRRDVETANRDFVELLKRLSEEGEIVAGWRGDEYT